MHINNNWKVFLSWLIVCISFTTGAQSAERKPVTFSNALQQTLQNNALMQQSAHHLLEMKEEVLAAKGLRYPKISLNGGYNRMEDRLHLDLSPVRDAILPIYQSLGTYGVFSGVANPDPGTSGAMPILPENLSTQVVRKKLLEGANVIQNTNWDITLQERQFAFLAAGVSWPIFVGGKINIANKVARLKYAEATVEEKQKGADLTQELVERYFGLALTVQAVEVRQAVKAAMELHCQDAEKLFKSGMMAQVELLNARLNLAEAERELQRAVRQQAILNDALLNTLAEQEKAEIIPITRLFYLANIEPLDHFIGKADLNSPILARIGMKKEMAGEGQKAERADLFPAVAVTAMYDLANKDLSPYLPGYTVGVGLKWNLFEGTSRLRKIKASAYQEMQAGDFYRKTEADIHTAINKHYQELNMYLEQLNALDKALEMAVEFARVRDKAFVQGQATATQVADAALLLARTKIERLQAIYGYDVALSKLLCFAGIPEQFESYMNRPETLGERLTGFESQNVIQSNK